MPADRVFRRTRNIQHTVARTMHRQSQHVFPKWARTILIVCGVSCFGLAIGVSMTIVVPHHYLQPPMIQTVDCQMQNGTTCPDEIVQSLQPLLGQPLLFSHIKEKLRPLLTPVGVTVTQYSRVLPDTLQLQIAPLDVQFYLVYQGNTTAITRTGVKLSVPDTHDTSLLVVQTEDQELGQQLSAATQIPTWIIQFVNDLSTFFTTTNTKPIKIIVRTPYEARLELVDQPHPIVLNPQESTLNLARLSTILKSEQYTEIATPGTTLDVRFRLPVLRR